MKLMTSRSPHIMQSHELIVIVNFHLKGYRVQFDWAAIHFRKLSESKLFIKGFIMVQIQCARWNLQGDT